MSAEKGRMSPTLPPTATEPASPVRDCPNGEPSLWRKKGLPPLEILRSYYPRDVEIAQTNIISGVLSSYPGTPLRVGSTGLDVQTIQTWLTRIRRNYPAIPAITDAEGQFQNSTRSAVAKFQSIFNLASDGIVGKATWYKLSQLYTAVTRLAELSSEGTSPESALFRLPPSCVRAHGDRMLSRSNISLTWPPSFIPEFRLLPRTAFSERERSRR